MTVARRRSRGQDPSQSARVFGEHARAVRLAQQLTLDMAAERMALDPKYLQKIEMGRVNLTLRTQTRVARGLGEPLGRFFDRAGAAAPVARQEGAAYRGHGDTSSDALLRRTGARVRRTRVARRLSQRELAHASGLSLSSVQQIELGHQNLTLRTLALLAVVLEVGAEELLGAGDAQGPAATPRVRGPGPARR